MNTFDSTVTHTSGSAADQPPFEPFRLRAQQLLFESLGDHLDRLTWDAERVHEFQTDRLRTLLADALERSPFHADRLAGIGAECFELDDLAQLPVMDKAEMMDRYDDVVTDRRLQRAALEQLIEATAAEPIPALGEYLVLTSGGSSGTRGVFVFDAAAVAEFCACSLRQSIANTAALGPPPPGATGVIVAAGSPIHATAATPLVSRGGPVAITQVPATLPFNEIVARVRDVDPGLLMGYPSVLARLAHEQLDGRLDLHPVAVTSISENLHPEVRALIEQAFGVPVVDGFGSSEGLLGASDPGDETLTFASDCCIVELVDEHDDPVAAGQPSSAVLVTNLYNFTQPLIRYRIEDRFVQQPFAAGHGHLRANVDGRASEMLRWGDTLVHPLTITNELIHTPAIVDYVVRQTALGVEIEVVAVGPVDLDSVRHGVARDLAVAGIPAADVVVSLVDDIGRNARTGKVARIVPDASA